MARSRVHRRGGFGRLLAPVISGVYVVARAARHSHARDAVEGAGKPRVRSG
jgi:hypothetical protein